MNAGSARFASRVVFSLSGEDLRVTVFGERLATGSSLYSHHRADRLRCEVQGYHNQSDIREFGQLDSRFLSVLRHPSGRPTSPPKTVPCRDATCPCSPLDDPARQARKLDIQPWGSICSVPYPARLAQFGRRRAWRALWDLESLGPTAAIRAAVVGSPYYLLEASAYARRVTRALTPIASRTSCSRDIATV
jgi:hypothetical protein